MLNFKSLIALGALALAALATDAQAFHGHHHGGYGGSWGGSYGGGWGSSGGSYGSWGGSSGGSYGGWGSSGGYGGSSGGGGGWFHRKHHGGGWGSSGGSSGGYGGSSGGWSYGGSSGGSSGGYSGGTVISDGVPVDAAPATPNTPAPPMPSDGAPAPPAPGDAAPTTYRGAAGAAMLTVRVPADAKVFVNGLATRSTGTERQYISRGLKPGAKYSYNVRVEYTQDGQPVELTKTVQLTAGQNADVAFTGKGTNDATAGEPVKTKLTVNVPADAKLYLAGREMQASGPVREFTTTQLTSGDAWASYVVRATIERDGQTLSKDVTINLAGGDEREVSIDFDTDKVAAAR